MSRTDDLDQIDDPGEYNQRRRIRAIHDARERIFEQRRRALDMKSSGRISEQQYLKILREAVESFLLEIEQLLHRYAAETRDDYDDHAETDDEPEASPSHYLTDVELGGVTIPPDGNEETFDGLLSILEFPDPYVAEWETYQSPPPGLSMHPDGGGTLHREEVQIPERVLLKATREATGFLNEVGLDAEIESDTPEYGFRELDSDELDALDDVDEFDHGGVIVDGR